MAAIRSFVEQPQSALRHLVRIFGREDGRVSYSVAEGTLSVQTEVGFPRPVCGFHTVRAHWFEPYEDGYIERLLAAIIPVDAATGNVLRTYRNPETGREGEPVLSPYYRGYFHSASKGTLRVDLESGEVGDTNIWSNNHLVPFRVEFTAARDVGWVNYVNPHELMDRSWSDCYRFRFAVSEAFGSETPSVASTYAYSGESPLPGWVGGLKEDQALWQACGVKCDTPSAVPAPIRRSIEACMPRIFGPPESWS